MIFIQIIAAIYSILILTTSHIRVGDRVEKDQNKDRLSKKEEMSQNQNPDQYQAQDPDHFMMDIPLIILPNPHYCCYNLVQ